MSIATVHLNPGLTRCTVFSHFLDISLCRFLGDECFEDYLGTLDSFLRAGASFGVPPDHLAVVTEEGPDGGAEAAFGKLARRRPEETVLASFCTELNGLLARLAADPQRAAFVSSVVERLILHSSDRTEDLGELDSAVSRLSRSCCSTPFATDHEQD